MDIDARAESSFKIDDYYDKEQKIQVVNFFLGLLFTLPIQNPNSLAELLWETLVKIQNKEERNTVRRDIIFKLTQLTEIKDISEQSARLNHLFRDLGIDPTCQPLVRGKEIILGKLDVEVLKPHTVSLKVNEREKIVFGAAPEFIKTFHAHGENIPEYLILSGKTFRDGINFAEIEFAIYDNFFFQHGRKLKIICTQTQETRLRIILQVTLLGPDFDRLMAFEQNEARRQELERLKAYQDFLAPRDNDGNIIDIDGYIEFIHFEDNTAELTLASGERIKILKAPENPDAFTIIDSNGEMMGYIDLGGITMEEFDFPVQRTPISRDEFGVFVLDSGDGFTPDKHTSSFLMWLEGKPLLVDPMAYSEKYLKRKGIDSNEIVDFFISHNHGDHDQGVYNYLIRGRRIRLIGSEINVQQTLKKVAAAIDTSIADMKNLVDVVPLPIGQEVELPGYKHVTVELEYAFHPIPTNMIKFRYRDKTGKLVKTLGYSGDTVFDPEKYEEWIKQGRLKREYLQPLLDFFKDADIIIHEAGGGVIHTYMEKVIKYYPKKTLYWVHTKLHESEAGGTILKSGDQLTFINEQIQKKMDWYLKLFEKVPLFSNLSVIERAELAEMAAHSDEIEVIEYLAGEVIIREGDLPNDRSFYIIAQGSVDILQHSHHIASLGVGQQLGEMALFGNNEGRRNATVQAFAGVKLLKIHEKAYSKYMAKIERAYTHYKEARPILDASQSPFKGLNHNILDNIATQMDKQVFDEAIEGKKRPLIIKGQAHNDVLYLIVEGEVGVIVDKAKGIGFRLGRGAVIGEMSLLDDDAVPMATVVPITRKVVVYTLNKQSLRKILEQYPPVRYILEGIAQRRKRQNQEAIFKYQSKGHDYSDG
ncbi:MAG: cyclic nucleotide-binding domain-containing protein [Spirochaetales bacterium]|nr:cyclic nucleotide-binding domain-containing protein [Spirochaetales bacterium]